MELHNGSEIPRQLEIARTTPICDLSPEIPDPASRAVRGIVTITWPYNSVKNSFAFILAEPDFRLRRNRGQVRVNFTGPAARALGECGLGGSDEIYLSLDGAEWEPEEVKKRQSLPGAGIEWQLRFSNKLLLQAKLGDVHETKVISIDGSAPTEPLHPLDEPVETPYLRDPPSPPAPTEFTAFTPAKDPRVTKLHDEYDSPAFIKRARISYGSLFEDGFDIFDDDGGVKGKGRKRTRFGRDSGAWRYSSQSASPEPPATSRSEDLSDEQVGQAGQMEQEHHISSPPKPGMADEGCQTMELDIATPVPAQISPNIASLEHQELPPVTETLHHPHENQVDQNLRTLPQKSFLSSSLGAFHSPGSTDASQHAPAHVAPFPLHEDDTINNNFQPQPETQHIDSTAHIYDVDPAIYEQAPRGLFLAPEDGSVGHHHPHNMEESGQTNLSYPPTDRANFARDIANGAHDNGQQGSPFPDAPQTYPHLGIADGEESRLSAPKFLTNYPPSFLEDSRHFPQQSVEAQPRFFSGEVDDARAPAAVQGGSASWTAVNRTSEATSLPQTRRFADADEGSPESPVVIDVGESDDESAPAPTAVEDTVINGHRDELEIYEDAEAEDEVDALYSDEDEPEYDGDEMGGDYDTRNYVGPNDDEDDSHDEDLRPRDLEPQFNNDEDWPEEEDLEEEEERRYQTDSENDYDLDEEEEGEDEEEQEEEEKMERPAPRVSQAAPIMIDLISSSEDEGEGEGEDEEDRNENENEQETANADGNEDGYVDENVDEDVDEDMDEDVDEDMDADEGVQLPQSHPARDAFVRTEALASRTRQLSDDEIESQQGGMSEPLSVTSDAQEEAVNMVETSKEEEAESVEGASSVDGDQQEDALPREDNGAFDTTTETGNDDKSQRDVKPITTDEHMLPMSHELAPAETSQENVDIAELEQSEALGTAPFTAAEGLEVLSRTVDREKDEAGTEASDKTGIPQVEPEETSPPILENQDEASQGREVDMAEDQVIEDDELPTQNDMQNSEIRDIEMTEPKVIVDGGDSPTEHEDLEPVDLIRSSPERPLEDQSIGESETLQEQTLAPSSSPLAQSFSSHPIETKAEHLTNEPTASSNSQPPVDQLLTPLNTQLTDTNKSQEKPVVPSPVDVDEAHDTTQTAEFEEHQVNQAMPIPKEVAEQDQVFATEVVTTQAEDRSSDQIEAQPQDLVSREDSEQLPQTSPSKSVPSITFQTQVDLDDIIQANIRGEAPHVQIDYDITINTLDADSSRVSSSFRSQMEGDEELQASILEDNSYLFSSGRQRALEAGVPSSQISESGSQYLDADKVAPETEMLDDIGGPPSPVLGSDDAAKPEKVQKESTSISHTEKNKQIPIESDDESLEEESSQIDPSVQLARAANATRPRAKGPQTTTDVDQPHGRSDDSQSVRSLEEDSSIQLARASMNSSFSSSFKLEEESSSLVEAKLQLARHLRDELPDCTQLQVLRHHTGQSLDVMAVAMMQPPDPQRAKRGPREYMMSFTIADQSTAPNAVVEVQLYRPHKDALPVVKPGDVVLLRKFRVVSLQGKGFGLRTEDGSSWAVWETAAVANHNDDNEGNEDAASQQPQVRGPPVEAIEKEARHAAYLREWFALLDEQARAKLERANQKIINAKKSSRKT